MKPIHSLFCVTAILVLTQMDISPIPGIDAVSTPQGQTDSKTPPSVSQEQVTDSRSPPSVSQGQATDSRSPSSVSQAQSTDSKVSAQTKSPTSLQGTVKPSAKTTASSSSNVLFTSGTSLVLGLLLAFCHQQLP